MSTHRNAGLGVLTLLTLAALASACDNNVDIIDTSESDSSESDTAYEGARIREPDAGWRAFIREAPAYEPAAR